MMIGRLHLYAIYMRTGENRLLDAIRFVKQDFIWPAFFFTVLWALYHRLWRAAAILVAFNLLCYYLGRHFGIGEMSVMALQVAVQVWFGFEAAEFLGRSYQRRGYTLFDIVSGENLMRAEQRFLDRHTELHALAV